jgi:hypothetical protein
MTMGGCHAAYLGVSYITVLRLPNIKGGYKAKKEPTKNYTLYQKNGRIFSLSSDGKNSNNIDCSYQSKPNNRKNNAKGSLMNRFTGFFKKNTKKNTRSKNLRNQNNEKTPLINQNNIPPQEKQGVFSKCSIL